MPVYIIILIMAANVLAVVVPPPPASNRVDQALDWIRFDTEVNRNRIHNEGGLVTFDNFTGLAVSDI